MAGYPDKPSGFGRVYREDTMTKLAITDNKGLHIIFDNGYTLSVQIGPGNYCHNRDMPMKDDFCGNVPDCDNAEIAIFDPDGEYVQLTESDDVRGWVDIDEIIDKASLLGRPNITSDEVIRLFGE